MKKISSLVFISMIFVTTLISLTGCQSAAKKVLPKHDEVLIYDLPYDLVYLRTMEALENVYGWELEETEKEKGIIVARNINFSRFDDADKRLPKFTLKRVSRGQTSIQLVPESQHVIGADTLMKRISQYVSREI